MVSECDAHHASRALGVRILRSIFSRALYYYWWMLFLTISDVPTTRLMYIRPRAMAYNANAILFHAPRTIRECVRAR